MSRRPIKPAIEHQHQQQQHQPIVSSAQVTDPNIVDKKGTDLSGVGLDLGGVDEDDLLSPTTPTTKKRKAQAAGSGGGAPAAAGAPGTAKRPRTNTPWTAVEEQRLKNMRDAGNSWSEIAKTFPTRTEGSVKKHWYKDMHYAEFGEDESAASWQQSANTMRTNGK
ncbi:hypothetical protein BDD12DRAFT_23020 [Trichophaea hybrida]|nr:hypothetical protein BDD12DRAFT_23020 [Trichophaea hybrida]